MRAIGMLSLRPCRSALYRTEGATLFLAMARCAPERGRGVEGSRGQPLQAPLSTRRGLLVALGCGLAFAVSMAIADGYLLWSLLRFHGDHFDHFEQLHGQLPLATRYAIALSLWFIRQLPMLIVLAVPGAGAVTTCGIVLAVVFRRRLLTLTKVVTAMALALGLAETGLFLFVLYGVLLAY